MAGKASIKMYDKLGRVLRIETTVNDVEFFKHYRKVEHRNGALSFKQAPLKKNIYSLPILLDKCYAANNRYLAFVSQLEDHSVGLKQVQKIAEPKRHNDSCFRGFNVLGNDDHRLFLTMARGEFAINGMTNRAIRRVMTDKTGSQMSLLLKRLRLHGMIKKVGRTYKYYLTKLGRATVLSALKLRELVVLPNLAGPGCQ